MRSGLFGVSAMVRSATGVVRLFRLTIIEAYLCHVSVEIERNSYDANSVLACDIKPELNIDSEVRSNHDWVSEILSLGGLSFARKSTGEACPMRSPL